jgi:cysteine desulfurase
VTTIAVSSLDNEIGVIQDIEAIGNLCRQHKIFFHVDAAQSDSNSFVFFTHLSVSNSKSLAHANDLMGCQCA